MARHLILCQNPALSASLELWLKGKGLAEEGTLALNTVGNKPDSTEVASAFEELAGWLDQAVEETQRVCGVPEVVVLTDLAGYGVIAVSDLNPVKQNGWATVLGMLIFAFPEIHWIFVAGNFASGWGKQVRPWHSGVTPEDLNRIFTDRRMRVSFLFDGSSLRDSIRGAMGADDSKQRVILPRREKLAVAVDEEKSYAWLHAYTAYRFGFRAQVVTTFGGMKRFLGYKANTCVKVEENPAVDEIPHLVFEDVFLQFSDEHLDNFSFLRKRDKICPWLVEARYRVLVTSGHHHGQDKIALRDNPNYLDELQKRGQWNCERQKPLGGIFNLWQKSELQVKLHEGGRLGLAPGYTGPMPSDDSDESTGSGHSAPGRVLVIADWLIARARRLVDAKVSSVMEAVYGAVLATDALELLGGKTPTTSLEALTLRHQCEVFTECHFVGMQEHIEVHLRVADVERDVKKIGDWFGKNEQERVVACWNAELTILDQIIDVFQNNNQFDEEQIVQAKARRLHRKLWFKKYWLLKPFEFAPWYVEKLVASFPLFLLALAGWIGVLGLVFWWAGSGTLHQGFAHSFSTFLSIQPPPDGRLWTADKGWNGQFCLIAFTMTLGFVHLGIFISHLYSLISRK